MSNPPPPPPSSLPPPKPSTAKNNAPKNTSKGGSIQDAIKSRAGPKKIEFNEEFKGKPLHPTNLLACGNGKYGRLAQGVGNGNSLVQFSFCKSVEEKLTFTTIAAGAGHTLALTAGGSVYAWGKCHFGQLGHGEENEDVHLPKKIDSLEGKNIVGLGCGWSYAFAVGANGNLYAWGCGFYGALGTGSEQSHYVPTVVPFFSEEEVTKDPTKKIQKIVGGSFHTAIITKTNKLFVCGRNTSGQLGLGNTQQKNTPTELTSLLPLSVIDVACGDEHTGIVTENGKVFLTGRGVLEPIEIKDLAKRNVKRPNVKKIAVGINQSLVLDSKGKIFELKEFGESKFERLRISSEDKKELQVKSIACGETHSLCISNCGKLFTWGDNYCNKLGHSGSRNPTLVKSIVGTPLEMVDAGSNHSFALAI